MDTYVGKLAAERAAERVRGVRPFHRNSDLDARHVTTHAAGDVVTLTRHVSTWSGANHRPLVSVTSGLNVTATPGTTVRLVAAAGDPDLNAVTIKWWQYADAGTYPDTIAFSAADALTTTFQVPPDATNGQTIHVLIQAMDNGVPPLTRVQRVIVTIRTP